MPGLVAEVENIQTRFKKLAPFLDERMSRLVAASESLTVGFGGTSVVSRQTGVSRRAIIQGIKELDEKRCGHSNRLCCNVGLGKPSARAGVGYRRYSSGISETRLGLSQSDD
jgi:hypothetical protein